MCILHEVWDENVQPVQTKFLRAELVSCTECTIIMWHDETCLAQVCIYLPLECVLNPKLTCLFHEDLELKYVSTYTDNTKSASIFPSVCKHTLVQCGEHACMDVVNVYACMYIDQFVMVFG